MKKTNRPAGQHNLSLAVRPSGTGEVAGRDPSSIHDKRGNAFPTSLLH